MTGSIDIGTGSMTAAEVWPGAAAKQLRPVGHHARLPANNPPAAASSRSTGVGPLTTTQTRSQPIGEPLEDRTLPRK